MKYSQLFGRASQNIPHDADSVNARLLTQGGFVDKLAAGVYSYLPLGQRVLKKILQIIREEMDAVGGQEILMPSLHPIELWKTTGRDKVADEILYRTKGAGDKDFVFAPSHEESVTPIAKRFVQSYKDLPFSVYQIQTKFRNEPRAKSGVLRGREFGMKDMYSFHTTMEDLDQYYDKVIQAYLNVYKRAGVEAYVVEASGGIFSDRPSHEFSVVTPAGEDTILICPKCQTAKNLEVAEKGSSCEKCGSKREEKTAIEAGNIFKLGTKYSEDFDLYFVDEKGERKHVIMGCYGIGTTRLVGTVVEASHDDKGIIWPKSVAPFQVHLLHIGAEEEAKQTAEKLYQELKAAGVDVLYDDRDESAGKKLNDADLIGIPLRLLVSKRSLKDEAVEWKLRAEKEAKTVSIKNILKEVKAFVL